jgi:hypothetical protein
LWRDDGTDEAIHDLLRCPTKKKVTSTVNGVRLLDKFVEHTLTATRVWVDAGFRHDLGIHGAVLGVDVAVVKVSDTKPGFVPITNRSRGR